MLKVVQKANARTAPYEIRFIMAVLPTLHSTVLHAGAKLTFTRSSQGYEPTALVASNCTTETPAVESKRELQQRL